MLIDLITIFPQSFEAYFQVGILKRVLDKKLIKLRIHDLRVFARDRRKTVDDTPYGGGAGMVMKIEPFYAALRALRAKNKNLKKQKVILLSAKGKTWNQQTAKRYAKLDRLILICGRYEGVDERLKHFVDEEISIGDYVLTGGELPAMVLVDSLARLLPGALGNAQSAVDESHSRPGVLEYPQYTKPEIFTVGRKSYRVPKILLSGDHKKIAEWRELHRI